MTDQDKQMEQVTQAASQLGKPHSNETVPHKISNHDMLVQASIWAGKDVGWLNLNDTQDQLNMKMDLHKVEKVVQGQVELISGVRSDANAAVSQAESAQKASNVNQAAITSMDSAQKATQQEVDDAVKRLDNHDKSLFEVNSAVSAAQSDIATQSATVAVVQSDVSSQSNAVTTIQTDLSTAKQQIKDADSNITAVGQTAKSAYAIASDANGNATEAKQTAGSAYAVATDTKSDVVQIKVTADSAVSIAKDANSDVVDIRQTASAAVATANNAKSQLTQIKLTADSALTFASDANSNAVETKQTADSAYTIAKNASSDVVQVKLTANSAVAFASDANKNVVDIHQTAKSAVAMATDAKSDAAKAALTANGVSTLVTGLTSQVTSLSDATKAVSDDMKNKADKGTVNKTLSQLTTSVKQTKDLLTAKADKLDVDKLSKTVTDTNDVLTQKADRLSNTITQVSEKAGKNTTAISNLTQTVDGLQTTVKNKADQSMISQLSNQILEKVSNKDYQTEIALLTKDLNLRVSKGDLISQINLEAGGNGLISVKNGKGKLLLDADSVIFGHQAFIPSAAITNIEADKIKSGTLDAGLMRVINLTADTIHGGTLDVGSMNVKNLSANDITTGTLTGIDISASDSLGNLFDMQGSKIKWFSKGFEVDKKGKPDDNGIHGVITVASQSSYDFYQGPNTTPYRDTIHFATDKDFWFTTGTDYEPDKDAYDSGIYAEFGMLGKSESDGNSPVGFYANTNRNTFSILSAVNGISPPPSGFGVEFNTINGMIVNLRPDNWKNNPGTGDKHWGYGDQSFNIQKDDHIGAYFGQGDNGNQINFAFGGDGGGFNVNGPLHVTGSKNSIVETRQGYLAINAYETAEYYFGDIGENNTGDTSQVVIGIDRIFNEVVNTDIQYQVFVTPYSSAHVWVEKRYNNRFIVRSDRPNAEFGWELKAKRKGYESNRLRRVNVDFNQMDLKGEN